LAVACSITKTDRDFPFHVKIDGDNLTGFIMSEQIKSINYNAKKVKFVEKVNNEVLDKVLGIVESVVF
jgi:mRNA interferase MazF